MRKIELLDTTFRDGQQSPLMFDSHKYKFNIEERKVLFKGLLELGVRYFEFFSPVVNNGEKDAFLELKKYARDELKVKEVVFIAHCRANESDINMSLEAGFDGLNLYFGTSKNSIKNNHGKSLSYIADTTRQITRDLKTQNKNIYLRFSGEDAFRTDLNDLYVVYDSIAEFVDTLGMPDTVGCATPKKVTTVVKALKNRYKNTNLETHFHNDRGLAFANMLAAVENGSNIIDSSVWGLAERSGINSTTGTLLNLYLQDPALVAEYKIENSYPLNVLMGSVLNMHVPYNEPVSLTNRTHIAGVHTGAVIKDPKVYEHTNLQKFGVTNKQLLLGPLSGWNIVFYYVNEVLGYECTREQAKDITNKFKSETERANKYNKPKDILENIAINYPLQKAIVVTKDVERLENLSSN